MRGIRLVSGLKAQAVQTGWVAVEAGDAGKARWLAEQIKRENVASYSEGSRFFVPVGEYFTVKSEIKNVITVVAKTTHYWIDHVPAAMKSSLAWEERLAMLGRRIKQVLGL